MPPPLPNLRTSLWCCAARLSRSARASRLPAHAPLSPGCAPARGCAASRSSRVGLGAAFFRLAELAHQRRRALDPRVLIQDGVGGITERRLIGNLLVVELARIRLTQVAHPGGLGLPHHHMLVAGG